MDSDQDSSADDWVVLDSCTSDDDDALVLALSSGCGTPCSATGSDADAEISSLLAAAAIAIGAAADAEGVYELSDAEDDDPCPAPLPRPLSGLFHHTLARAVTYAPFDPTNGGHGAKQLVPDPTFSALIYEGVTALASTRGLVCLRGEASRDYYVANPATFTQARLPASNCDHFARGEPAVVITFDLDDDRDEEADDDRRCFYRHYHVVVAFPMEEGIYAFESFSSRTWGWTIGNGIADAETVIPESGVGALGSAFWRTTMGYFLCFDPVSGCSHLVPAPEEVTQWPYWELCEMEGALCAACMDDPVSAVLVIALDFARRDTHDGGRVAGTLLGHFEGGYLRGRQHVTLLRSQGKAEVVMWDHRAEMVVAMDLEGRTTRTIRFLPPGTGYYADFIPYVSSLAAVSASGAEHLSGRKRKTDDLFLLRETFIRTEHCTCSSCSVGKEHSTCNSCSVGRGIGD